MSLVPMVSLVENKESLVPLPPGPMVPLVYKNMSLALVPLVLQKGVSGPLVSLVKNKESLVPLPLAVPPITRGPGDTFLLNQRHQGPGTCSCKPGTPWGQGQGAPGILYFQPGTPGARDTFFLKKTAVWHGVC